MKTIDRVRCILAVSDRVIMPTSNEHARKPRAVEFRFYAELNDFLPAATRQRALSHRVAGTPSVKDAIEAIGVPHTEVDAILVDGRSVGFPERLHGGERVAVYPVFERLDVSTLTRLRPVPLRVTRFVADVQLGTLARSLRRLGFDTVWHSDLVDNQIIDIASKDKRIILTRNRRMLKDDRVTRGHWVRAAEPALQLDEVVRALDLGDAIRPQVSCLESNAAVEPVGLGKIG